MLNIAYAYHICDIQHLQNHLNTKPHKNPMCCICFQFLLDGKPILDKLLTLVTFYMYFHIGFLPRRNNQMKSLVQFSFISFSITPSLFGYTCDYTIKMPKLEWVFLHRSFKKESHSLSKGLSCVASPEYSSSSIITRSITYDKWPTWKALVHVSNINFLSHHLYFSAHVTTSMTC